MMFLNEYSYFRMIYFLKTKDETLVCFTHYISYEERETGRKLKVIQSNARGEYTSYLWNAYCESSGIKHPMGPPHSPHLNRIAKRYNHTTLNRLIPTLFQSQLEVWFWESAARKAGSFINLSQCWTNKGNSSSYSLWSHNPSTYSSLRAYGCKGYRLMTGPSKRGKLLKKGNPCILLNTLPDGDGWTVWDVTLAREVKTHDVVFFERESSSIGKPNT